VLSIYLNLQLKLNKSYTVNRVRHSYPNTNSSLIVILIVKVIVNFISIPGCSISPKVNSNITLTLCIFNVYSF